MIDIQISMPDGSITRVRKISPVATRRGAEQYEREVREAVLAGTRCSKEDELAVPTFASFAAYFIDTYATTNNRPSTVREKRRALHRGMLGHLGLDQIGARQIHFFGGILVFTRVSQGRVRSRGESASSVMNFAALSTDVRQPPAARSPSS